MNKNYWILGAVLVIIVLAIGFFVHAHRAKAPTTPDQSAVAGLDTSTGVSESTGNAAVGATGASEVVTYTDAGFSPASLTVSQGTTVTWINKSSQPLWVASDNHPTHTVYDGTDTSKHCVAGAPAADTVFDECTQVASGGSYSFTFVKTGTWSYHNHVHSSDQGTIVVTAATAAGPINPKAVPE